jgi:hypothetical protein
MVISLKVGFRQLRLCSLECTETFIVLTFTFIEDDACHNLLKITHETFTVHELLIRTLTLIEESG